MVNTRPPMRFPETWEDFGPKVQALRERERRFVWAYLCNALTEGVNGAQAARDAGYSDVKEGAKVRAHGLLHRNDVLEAMQEVAARELRGLMLPAVVALGRLVEKRDHPDHRKAIEMVLDRTGAAVRTAIDVNVNGHVTVNHTDQALEDLARLRELGVPREKLLEIFGFTGLPRYERMLDERSGTRRPAPALIEGKAEEATE